MKNLHIILIVFIVAGGCSAQNEVVLKELTQEKSDELQANKTVKCEQYIEGTMKYKKIEDIEKRKLNKFKREAKKCECNTVYLDFNNYTGGAHESDNLFFAVCVRVKVVSPRYRSTCN